jgi:hypothetical protein
MHVVFPTPHSYACAVTVPTFVGCEAMPILRHRKGLIGSWGVKQLAVLCESAGDY